MDQILFFVFAAVAAASALVAVTRKNAVASACWLVVMFFGLAAVYVLLEAYFVAAVQILVYAGAIMVLFLFVIMLLDLRSTELAAQAGPKLKLVGIALSGLVLAGLLHVLRDATSSALVADRVAATLRLPAPPPPPPPPPPADGSAPAVPVALPAAPVPATVELAELRAFDRAATEMGETPDEGAGDRVYGGTLVVEPGRPGTPLEVRLPPEGAPRVSIGGKALAAPAWAGEGTLKTATVSVPGAAAGTTLELSWRRGGLEASPAAGPDGSPRGIGRALFEHWLLPFEVASLLLTGAIFGAVVLTKRRLS